MNLSSCFCAIVYFCSVTDELIVKCCRCQLYSVFTHVKLSRNVRTTKLETESVYRVAQKSKPLSLIIIKSY